jgi:hypothetical protein
VPNVLHQVSVPIMDNEKCQRMFTRSGHKKKVRSSFLCAGYDDGKKDSCEVRATILVLNLFKGALTRWYIPWYIPWYPVGPADFASPLLTPESGKFCWSDGFYDVILHSVGFNVARP